MALMIAANYHLPAGIDRFTFGGELQQDNAGEILLGKLIVRDMSLYKDLVLKGSIGAAEAYIDGKCTSADLTAVIRIFAKAQQITDHLVMMKNSNGCGYA